MTFGGYFLVNWISMDMMGCQREALTVCGCQVEFTKSSVEATVPVSKQIVYYK
jgi:hypothetical protein